MMLGKTGAAVILIAVMMSANVIIAQPSIHSHNDYAQARPLWNALENRADYIEADIFLIGQKLYVAHAYSDLKDSVMLERLYLKPIDSLVARSGNGDNNKPRFTLFIDIKNDASAVLPVLYKLLDHYPAFKKNSIRVVISGNRGQQGQWPSAPRCVSFDGRPSESYNRAELRRVALISDAYVNHSAAGDSAVSVFVSKSHNLGKPCRLWGAPDNRSTWERLLRLGVDVINTDQVAAVRAMITSHNR